jgi:hypothetical protein
MNKLRCPQCGLSHIKRNGLTHYGKQNYWRQDCDRRFVEDSQRIGIDSGTFRSDALGWHFRYRQVLDEAVTCVINSYTGSVYRGCGDPDRALRLTKRNGAFMSRICSRNTFVNSLTELESYWPLGLKVKLKTLSVATGTPSRIAGL